MAEFFRDYGEQVVTVLLAFVAAVGAIWAFYREKEYDLVRERYLDQGLDLLAGEIQHALQVEVDVFQSSFNVLRHYRDLQQEMSVALLEHQALPLDMTRFRTTTALRVQNLVDDDSFWNLLQLVYARVREFSNVYHDEILHEIRSLVSGRAELQMPVEVYAIAIKNRTLAYHTHIIDLGAKSLGLVQNLINEIEPQEFTLRTLRRFRRRPRVQETIESAKQLLRNAQDWKRPSQPEILAEAAREFSASGVSGAESQIQ